MAELEGSISEFYKTCANIWAEEKEFWSGNTRDEIRHAANIKEMANILSRKPERFELGRPFNVFSLQTTISGVKGNIQKLKSGELTQDQALFLSLDMENSILESKYSEILKTNDLEYQNLVLETVVQTVAHKSAIEKKVKEKRGRPFQGVFAPQNPPTKTPTKEIIPR